MPSTPKRKATRPAGRENNPTRRVERWLLRLKSVAWSGCALGVPPESGCFAAWSKRSGGPLAYLDIVRNCLTDPPPESWDGVHVMKMKQPRRDRAGRNRCSGRKTLPLVSAENPPQLAPASQPRRAENLLGLIQRRQDCGRGVATRDRSGLATERNQGGPALRGDRSARAAHNRHGRG